MRANKQREQAEREQAAQRQADWQRQEDARRQEEARLAEQRRREQEQAQQRPTLSPQQMAEIDQREREAALRRLANPPPAAPPPLPAQVEAAPGIPVTAIDQVKPRNIVFAQTGSGWQRALVQWRRGAVVQVRFENGAVEQFTITRLRLQADQAVAADESPARPEALRAVVAARDPAHNPEPEDDALLIAKPRTEGADTNPPATNYPTHAPATNAPAPMFRQWSNDTGEFKVEAEFVGFEFDLVQLKKRDGKIISVHIDKLSATDQAHIRERFP